MSRPVNPYTAGAPLRGERGFFGRQDTLDWVARELRNPTTNALILFGQRRIGKTTLLLKLKRTLPANAFLPVYFDLQDQATRSLGQVLADLSDTVAEQTHMESPNPEAFDDRGRFFRHQFLPQLYQALEEDCRPVLLLDEFDVLDQADEAELSDTVAARALFPFLRRVMTEDPRLAFVFVVGRRAEDLSLDFTSTFKASLVREVWVLDQESARALVRQAEDNGTLRFTNRAVVRILSLTCFHPYLTQLLCQRIWERAYTDNPTALPQIDISDVEAAVPDALEAGDQALIWLWNGLGPAEKIYASALAEVADEGKIIPEDHVIQVLTAHAARLRTREVELAPRDLVKRRVLEEVGEREYRFAVELFRRWLCQHKPLQDVKDELDQVNPLAERLFGVGQGVFRRRQWEMAIRYFQDALEANPRHFRARLHLGETLLELGQTDEAVTELEQAYELDREEARLPLARALVAQAKMQEAVGNEESALAACERAVQVSPNERAAQEVKAVIWLRRGDAALGRDDLEAALSAFRKAGAAKRIGQVGDAVLKEGNLETALAIYREVGNAERITQVGDAALEEGNLRIAFAAYRQVDAVEKITRVGDAALERDDLETALAAYREVGVAERICQVEALQRRRELASLEAQARAHERTERWSKASAIYEQLVIQAPDEESRTDWQAALERCREEEELARLFAEGVGALEQGDWKRAQYAFAEVIHYRPSYQKSGRLAVRLLDQAVAGKRAFSLRPDVPGWAWVLGTLASLLLVGGGLLWGVARQGRGPLAALLATPTVTLMSTPTQTPTVTLMSTPTQTPTATSMSTPTCTPTARPTFTPTRKPTAAPAVVLSPSISVAVSDAEVSYHDEFDKLTPTRWNYTPSRVSVVGSSVEITGQSFWTTNLNSTMILREGEGILVLFKFDSGAELEFYLYDGDWAMPNYKRWGVYAGSYFQTNIFQGNAALGGRDFPGGLTLSPDTWYYLLLGVDQGGEFVALAWERSNSSRQAKYQRTFEEWAGQTWKFSIGANQGKAYVDSFTEISFSKVK